MPKLSAQELAELVPCSAEHVERLTELGLLEAQDDGLYPSSGVHVVRLMAAFEEAGISLEDVAHGVAAGELSFPLGLFLPEPVQATATYEALAAELGRPPELPRRLGGELGLPPPEDDRLRDEDADMLRLVVTTLDLADDDELSRFARLYGGTIQRLVGSGLQFFDLAVRQKVSARRGLSNEEKDTMVYQRAGAYTELVQGLVSWLQRRHREHEGKPVKWLGDGVMFHFREPGDAVLAAVEMVEVVGRRGLPPAHVGIHAGPVVYQEGDYFGRTVNLAARIADYARPDEVLVSQEVVDAADAAPVSFVEIGPVELKGVPGTLRLYTARRPS